MKTSEYKDFVMPLPLKGLVDLEIVDAEELNGKKPDENGVCSTGLQLVFNIAGPPEAMMTDGNSAVGFSFKQKFWEPRESADKNWAARTKRDFGKMLSAAFGENVPEDVQPMDWVGRHLMGYIGSEYDDFTGENVAKVTRFLGLEDLKRQAQ